MDQCLIPKWALEEVEAWCAERGLDVYGHMASILSDRARAYRGLRQRRTLMAREALVSVLAQRADSVMNAPMAEQRKALVTVLSRMLASVQTVIAMHAICTKHNEPLASKLADSMLSD